MIPIVMLHHVHDGENYKSLLPYVITRKKFSELLNFIEAGGYSTITFHDEIENPGLLKQHKSVILSFDDCPRHLFDFAIPELMRRGMKACFYTPTAHIGGFNEWNVREGMEKVELMNADELNQLAAMNMEIGSHGHFHIDYKTQHDEKIRADFAVSRQILTEVTGRSITSLAYPYGSVPPNYQKLLTDLFGFGLAIYHPFENNLTLRRFIYHEGDNGQTLAKKFSSLYRLYRFVSDPFKKY